MCQLCLKYMVFPTLEVIGHGGSPWKYESAVLTGRKNKIHYDLECSVLQS